MELKVRAREAELATIDESYVLEVVDRITSMSSVSPLATLLAPASANTLPSQPMCALLTLYSSVLAGALCPIACARQSSRSRLSVFDSAVGQCTHLRTSLMEVRLSVNICKGSGSATLSCTALRIAVNSARRMSSLSTRTYVVCWVCSSY